MAIINYIHCTASLRRRLFRQLLSDMSALCNDLIIHNDIRWLSKGNTLKRFHEQRERILAFPHNSKQEKGHSSLSLMENGKFSAAVCFLSDVFHHLNQFDMERQGKDKTATQLVERLHVFHRKLTLLSADLHMSRQNAPLPHIAQIADRPTNHRGDDGI